MGPKPKRKGRPVVSDESVGSSGRTPKVEPGLLLQDDGKELQPCWDFSLLDDTYEGEWDWDLTVEESKKFFGFLKSIQTSSWAEIQRQTYNGKQGKRSQLHHTMPTTAICPEAQERLHELKLGESEELFRFRLGSEIRLWGVFLGHWHRCYILWWDRGHRVYPMD